MASAGDIDDCDDLGLGHGLESSLTTCTALAQWPPTLSSLDSASCDLDGSLKLDAACAAGQGEASEAYSGPDAADVDVGVDFGAMASVDVVNMHVLAALGSIDDVDTGAGDDSIFGSLSLLGSSCTDDAEGARARARARESEGDFRPTQQTAAARVEFDADVDVDGAFPASGIFLTPALVSRNSGN